MLTGEITGVLYCLLAVALLTAGLFIGRGGSRKTPWPDASHVLLALLLCAASVALFITGMIGLLDGVPRPLTPVPGASLVLSPSLMVTMGWAIFVMNVWRESGRRCRPSSRPRPWRSASPFPR
jgi:hypothetical protein